MKLIVIHITPIFRVRNKNLTLFFIFLIWTLTFGTCLEIIKVKGGQGDMNEYKSNLKRLALEQQAHNLQAAIHNASTEAEQRLLHNKLQAVRKSLSNL